MAHNSSRDITDLHPELAKRWLAMVADWKVQYPSEAVPFLTQTYRNFADQNADYAKGRTTHGKVITQAQGGQSLHNYYPALAFDIAFKTSDGKASWNEDLFSAMGAIAHKHGLAWGGSDWKHGKDTPHFEPKNFTWHDAAAGKQPVFA